MIKRTQFINEANKEKTGVYFINELADYHNIEELKHLLEKIQGFVSDKTKGISKLRQWLTELHKDTAKAKFMMDRIQSVNSDFYSDLKLENYRNKPSVLNDLILLHSFNQMYKNNNNEN
jgi:hypothetical protein